MQTFLSRLLRCLPLLAAVAQPAAVLAAELSCRKDSPPHTVALLELYTSEGCSSCPPADRAIGALRTPPPGMAPDRVVPLALHVDYWDSLGWKDPFASRVFSERQTALSALAARRTIYTPEIFLAGRELRDWRGSLADAVRRVNTRPAQASISLAAGRPAGGALPIEASAKTAAADASLYLALYQNALVSSVRAGENGGAVLHHDFVVRDWVGPIPLGRAGSTSAVRALRVPPGATPDTLGVAAFVQRADGEVLQALSLPACAG
ncbi:MAG: DUF1223 domain-containing protein [Burkholderiaceae bacterium]